MLPAAPTLSVETERGDAAPESFRENLLGALKVAGARDEPPRRRIENCVRAALLAGLLRGGDRLPSVREVSEACGISRHATSRAYAALAAAHLVEARERSGVFVASVASPAQEPGPATARWLVEVLAQAYEHHRIKIPHVPDLIRHWTASVPLMAACVESVEDLRAALAREVRNHFGLAAEEAPLPDAAISSKDGLVPLLRSADLWVTTTYHSLELGALARSLGKTLVAGTLNPVTVSAIDERLRTAGELTIVCVDPAFGERIRLLHGDRYGDAIRVVEAGDGEAVAALDRASPVLLTAAARERLGQRADFRLVASDSSSFSPDFTRSLLTHVVRLNVERSRQ